MALQMVSIKFAKPSSVFFVQTPKRISGSANAQSSYKNESVRGGALIDDCSAMQPTNSHIAILLLTLGNDSWRVHVVHQERIHDRTPILDTR
mmetsp:Transcript_35308/g.85649  ORF Transcript_35308/g.85649 Transcript_35308/m.85649 type:complete len:92 (-) Transcript_35308:693-968(-)